MTDPNRKKRTGKKAPWPKGQRRNDPHPPAGFESLEAFWFALDGQLQRWGAKTELAEYLNVHRKTLQFWLSRTKIPQQSTVNRIGRWLKKNVKH